MSAQYRVSSLTAVVIALLLASSTADAKVYRWVDAKGGVHFSDVPVEGAIEVELKPETSNQILLPPAQVKAVDLTASINYQLSISSPSNEETIRDNNGNFIVTLTLAQERPRGALYQLLLDGAPYNQGQASSSFELTGVNRGSHTLQALLVTGNGQTLAQSGVITIFMHQAVYHPPRPQPRTAK